MSTVILGTDDTKLNQKGCKVSSHFKDLCEEKNVYLNENYKRIKPQHLNKPLIKHLNKNGSKIFSNNFE